MYSSGVVYDLFGMDSDIDMDFDVEIVVVVADDNDQVIHSKIASYQLDFCYLLRDYCDSCTVHCNYFSCSLILHLRISLMVLKKDGLVMVLLKFLERMNGRKLSFHFSQVIRSSLGVAFSVLLLLFLYIKA